ncbi:hypothetical protein SEA_FRANKLIN22_25 [Microbacterium phage Franklin22]|uniref:hypothetical protein n=1 Tax=Microbacterium phage Franklin22 TaxID=2894293 RepID=UPI001E7861DA|nr:hypothetical protein QDW15_gp25 [Microbacterium phage Franklin22]UGL61838.1 hypothetical protein SEA_FRANKLIN22_25 [Microbacterium phage Franklin22]
MTNPQNLQPGDQVRLTGPGWGTDRQGNLATISFIAPNGEAHFEDERPGNRGTWVADEIPESGHWAVAVVARVMPAHSPITEQETLLTTAIRDMTENPWQADPAIHHQQTPAQAYMAQRDQWIGLLERNEPSSLDIFIENYAARTDFDNKPGEPRVFDAVPLSEAEFTAAGLLKAIPPEWFEEQARRNQLTDVSIAEEPLTKRQDILRTAESLIHGDREQDYGRPIDSFTRVAAAFNLVLQGIGHPPIDPMTAAKLMIALKLSRLAGGDNKDDTWVDLAGYAALGAEVRDQQ